jgi:diguanylate cyclase (GGDEF)-like protein
LNANLREADLPGVYNGNFLVILPATTEAGARVAAERLVGTLSPKQVLRNGETFEISICIGIVSHPGGKGISMARLLAAAPQALAQAQKKRSRESGVDRRGLMPDRMIYLPNFDFRY